MHRDGNVFSLGGSGAASLAGAGSLRPPQPGHGASFALTSQHTESGWWAKKLSGYLGCTQPDHTTSHCRSEEEQCNQLALVGL